MDYIIDIRGIKMDKEKSIRADEEDLSLRDEISEEESFEAQKPEIILVPDDAFAQNDAVEEEEIEMLPPSLADDDDFLDENEDPLFTDEELASIVQKAAPASQEESDSQPASYTEPEPIIEDADPLTASAPSEPKQKKIDGIFDVLEMFVFALAFVLIAMAFCFRHSVVDGPSMMNTLQHGEHLIISSLFYSPKQGDIVVVQDASKENSSKNLAKPIVKRVIATEGQTVKIYYDASTNKNLVYVDNVLLDEPYVYIDEPDYTYRNLEMTVPEGCVFLMGDHRNNSADSRGTAGAFREEAILGKVVLRFLPIQRFGTVK